MMKSMKKILCSLVALATCFGFVAPSFAHDGGAGLVWIRSPYKGHDDYYIPFPSLQVNTKYFFIKGLNLGFNLYKDDAGENELTLGITPGFLMFNPDKTNNYKLERLDKRRMAADVYLQYAKSYRWGTFGGKIYFDALGNADGFGADVFYKLPIFINQFTITPGAGLNFTSGDRNDYYFGVSAEEASRSGLRAYNAGYSLSPYVFVEASLLTETGMTIFANMQYTFYSDEITDSPMVGEKRGLMVTAGAMFAF